MSCFIDHKVIAKNFKVVCSFIVYRVDTWAAGHALRFILFFFFENLNESCFHRYLYFLFYFLVQLVSIKAHFVH